MKIIRVAVEHRFISVTRRMNVCVSNGWPVARQQETDRQTDADIYIGPLWWSTNGWRARLSGASIGGRRCFRRQLRKTKWPICGQQYVGRKGEKKKERKKKDVSVVENNNKKEKLVPRFNKSRTTAAAVSVGRLALLHYCAKWPNKGDNQWWWWCSGSQRASSNRYRFINKKNEKC